MVFSKNKIKPSQNNTNKCKRKNVQVQNQRLHVDEKRPHLLWRVNYTALLMLFDLHLFLQKNMMMKRVFYICKTQNIF